VRLDAIDRLMQPERFLSRQVPPELVLLAHDQREAAAVSVLAMPGREAQRGRVAGGRIDQPAEQFQRRGLACSVRAEERDHLPFADGETHSADSRDGFVLAAEEAGHRRPQALAFVENAVDLRQLANINGNGRVGIGGHAEHVMPLAAGNETDSTGLAGQSGLG